MNLHCRLCGSRAIDPLDHGYNRDDNINLDLCDVCYQQVRKGKIMSKTEYIRRQKDLVGQTITGAVIDWDGHVFLSFGPDLRAMFEFEPTDAGYRARLAGPTYLLDDQMVEAGWMTPDEAAEKEAERAAEKIREKLAWDKKRYLELKQQFEPTKK